MRTATNRCLSLVLIVQLVISSFYTRPALASVTIVDPPNIQPLSVCWLTQSKATGSTDWQIVNLNLSAVSNNPDVKLRYNWRVFGAPNIAGQIVQAASGWDTVKASVVNTVYSQSMLVEWYLVTKGVQSSILGSAQANANNDSLCPSVAVTHKVASVTDSAPTVHHEQPPQISIPVVSAAQVPASENDASYKVLNSDDAPDKLNVVASSSNYYAHTDTIGVYRPSTGIFYLNDVNNGIFAASSVSMAGSFGSGNFYPITGDWVGNHYDTVGLYDETTTIFYLKYNNFNTGTIEKAFSYGIAGDQPVSGRWVVGAARDGIGVYRRSNGLILLRNDLSSGNPDFSMVLGSPGDMAVFGDWNGDGVTSVGIYRPTAGAFYLGSPACNSCSVSIGYAFNYGSPNMKPIAGDWTNQGHFGVAVYDSPNISFYLKKLLSTGYADISFREGVAGDIPLAGRWGSVTPPSATPTSTFTPSKTYTPTYTFTPSNTATFTPTYTFTPSKTYTASNTATFTPTYTFTPSKTYTASNTATFTPTYTFTPNPTYTFTPNPTYTPTATFTPSNTNTSTPSPTSTSTANISATPTSTTTPNVLAYATLVLSPITDGPNLPSTTETLTALLLNNNGMPLAGYTIRFIVSGSNIIQGTATTGIDGKASFTYTGVNSGQDTVSSQVVGAVPNITSNTSQISWVVPTNIITTKTIWGRFFTSPGICVFPAAIPTKPDFEQEFPVLNFNDLAYGVQHRPFTNVIRDVNNSIIGTIPATGNGLQAGVGTMGAFYATFTSQFIVSQAGDVTFNFDSDDGFILGIGTNDPTSPDYVQSLSAGIPSSYYNVPASGVTAFQNLHVVGAYNNVTGVRGTPVAVHFPHAGVYNYEVDYTECAGGELVLTMRMGNSRIPPSTSLKLDPVSNNLAVNNTSTFRVTALDASNQPVPNLHISVIVNGTNGQQFDVPSLTNSQGYVDFQYTGVFPGQDLIQAITWNEGIPSYSPQAQVIWTGQAPVCTGIPNQLSQLSVPGVLDDTALNNGITGSFDIKLRNGTQLDPNAARQVDYWPVDNLPSGIGSTLPLSNDPTKLATLDTTLLANGSYVVRFCGTSSNQQLVQSAILVKVVGNYKPGRVRFSVTDLTVPVAGLPITIGRTYDSLDRNRVGDFGNGWSLDLGSPQIQVNQSHDVTLTQPNGQRVTYYFAPQPGGGFFGFLQQPAYQPEPGVYGKLESIGCNLLTPAGGQYFCFPGNVFQPSGYKYTDPYGRVFVYSINIDPVTYKQTSQLVSITDLNHNTLTFGADGIRSSVTSKAYVHFERDTQGRITSITDTNGKIYVYAYDLVAAGDLDKVTLPQVPLKQNQMGYPVIQYHYWAGHYFKDVIDPLNQKAVFAEYNPDGRLKQQTQYGTDATVSYLTTYGYNLATHTTTQTNPDTGVNVTTYNDYGDLLTQVQQQADGTVLHQVTNDYYANSHNVRNVTTAINGSTSEVVTYKYDGSGNRIEVINNGTDNAAKSVMQMSYNQYSEPLTITIGKEPWMVEYDNSTGMPQQVTDTLNGSISLVGSYTWDTHGSPLTKTDGNGNRTNYVTDNYGNVTSVTAPIQGARTATTSYQYDDMGRQIQVKDARNHIINYVYDDLGNVISVENMRDGGQLSYFTRYEYDLNRNKTAMIDPRGLRTTYGYDYANRLVKVTYSDNTFSLYTYDFRGNKLSKTDQAGHVMTYNYDVAGQLVKTTRIGDGFTGSAITTYQYDLAGRKTLETDPNLNQTTYHYNHLGQMDVVTAPENRITKNNYDDAGQLTDSYDSKGYRTHYMYDIRGRLTDTYYDDDNRAAHPNPVHQDYDNAGRVTARTDQNGKITSYVYFDNGQLRTVTQSLSQPNGPARLLSTNYLYDDVGNMKTITDAKSQVTSFQYDEFNRQVVKTWPDGSQELFQYDSDGNLTDHALPNDAVPPTTSFSGNNNHYTYNPDSNLLKTVNYFDGQGVTYGYTTGDMRQTVTDARGTTTYGYDALGRVNRVTLPNNQVVSYGYDLNSNRTSMTSPAGTTGYDYYSTNQLKAVKDASGSHIADYTYDANGMRSNLSYINGVSIDYGYNNFNQLTSITQHKGPQPIASYAYTLDATGSRTAVKDTIGTNPIGTTTNWTYDDLYRLIGESRGTGNGGTSTPAPSSTGAPTFAPATITPGGPSATPAQTGTPTGGNANPSWATTYGYDDVGNRTKKTENGQSTLYAYNNLNQLTCSGINAAIASNTCTNAQSVYTYNGRGDLRTVGDTSNALNNVSYIWDARDRMTGATVGAQTVTYKYDDGSHRVQQTVSAQITNYLWDEFSPYGDVIQEADGTGAPIVNYVLGGTELLTQTRGLTTNYYMHDGQNSVRMLADTKGDVTDRYVYDAFGVIRSATGIAGRSTTSNNYFYTSQFYNFELSIYSFRARNYSANFGRFTQRDAKNLNDYIYTAENPINYYDPSGRDLVDISGIDATQTGAVLASVRNRKFVEGAALGAISSLAGFLIGTLIKTAWQCDIDNLQLITFRADSGCADYNERYINAISSGLRGATISAILSALVSGFANLIPLKAFQTFPLLGHLFNWTTRGLADWQTEISVAINLLTNTPSAYVITAYETAAGRLAAGISGVLANLTIDFAGSFVDRIATNIFGGEAQLQSTVASFAVDVTSAIASAVFIPVDAKLYSAIFGNAFLSSLFGIAQ